VERLLEQLQKYGWQFRKGLPTILEINGEAVLRRDWRRRRIGARTDVRRRARQRAIGHAFRHGRYTAEATAEPRAFATLLRDMKSLVERVDEDQ
jgi:hypothetical protein